MTQQQKPQDQNAQAPSRLPFDPGHVMTRERYERLAREAAGQK